MEGELIPREIQNDADTLEAVMLADEVAEGAALITVMSAEEQDFAATELMNIVARRDALQAAYKRVAEPFKIGLERLADFFAEPLKRLQAGEDAIRRAIVVYQRQTQATIDEQRRDAMQSIESKVDELRAQAEECEAASLIKSTMEEAEDMAAQAADFRRRADELAQQHVPVERAPQVSGVSTRANWKAEVTDIDKLIEHCQENKEHRKFLTVDQSALNNFAKMTKGATPVPGIRIFNQGTAVVRRKRSPESPEAR